MIRAGDDLACAQELVARVSADIAKAHAAQDLDLVIRLNGVSKRILDLDAKATAHAVQAEHLASRSARLVEAIDAIEANCTSMDSIYE